MDLTSDSQVMLLLCSNLGLAGWPDIKPLTLREWLRLTQKLQTSLLGHPSALLGRTAADLEESLDLPESEAKRLAQLLDRGGVLAIELERLQSLGIWVLTLEDDSYPKRLRRRLKNSAPAVLFGVGEEALLGQTGLAVVGSRHVDDHVKACAEFIGNACAYSGLVLYSGGAHGVDALSTGAALGARGTAVSVLAHSLERTIRGPETRLALTRGDLALVTPYSPNAGFSVGAAMGRNKLIYALADYALVIASDAGKGGTWAGAIEALKAGWVPVFVLTDSHIPEGNRRLLQKGGIPFPESSLTTSFSLRDWLESHAVDFEPPPVQGKLL